MYAGYTRPFVSPAQGDPLRDCLLFFDSFRLYNTNSADPLERKYGYQSVCCIWHAVVAVVKFFSDEPLYADRSVVLLRPSYVKVARPRPCHLFVCSDDVLFRWYPRLFPKQILANLSVDSFRTRLAFDLCTKLTSLHGFSARFVECPLPSLNRSRTCEHAYPEQRSSCPRQGR